VRYEANLLRMMKMIMIMMMIDYENSDDAEVV
jgi:hypothetical protein